MSGTIGITCTVQSAVKKKELYFKAIDVLETTYNSVKLSYLTNLDKESSRNNFKNNDIMTIPGFVPEVNDGSFTLSGQIGVDYTEDSTKYLIKSTCKEITLSGYTTKIIEAESGSDVLIINLNNINAPNAQMNLNRETHINIKENSTNNLKYISGTTIEFYGDNNENSVLNIVCEYESDYRSTIEANIIRIFSGVINSNATIGKNGPAARTEEASMNGGVVTTYQFGAGNDSRGGNININGGYLFIKNNLGNSGGDDTNENININGGIVYFNRIQEYQNFSITNCPVIISNGDTAWYDNDVKTKNKGIFIHTNYCTSMEYLKAFEVKGNTVTINRPMMISAGDGELFIGSNSSVIADDLYFPHTDPEYIEDKYRFNLSSKAPSVGTLGPTRMINNGVLTIGYLQNQYNSSLTNNGTIYKTSDNSITNESKIKGSGIIKKYSQPETTLTLSGQEGVDWIQEENRYLIKNTCNEITISGSSNKNIEAEEGENDLTINLNGINAPTTQITTNRTTTVFIKENSTNNLKSIILNGNFENKRTITLSGDNDVNCTLNVSSIIVNTFSTIEINNGIINASSIIGAEGLGNIGKVVLNGGIVNTDQFGGSDDGRTENGITINNGILYTNILGCSGGDGYTSDVKFLGGVVRFNYWESYRLSEISNSAVIITPTQSIFDTLKLKNKGLIIQSQQFTSIDSLKIFDINNKTGEITIKEPLTIEHGTGPDDCGKMIINNGCKVISNNLYFEDAGRSTGQKWGDPDSWGSLFINNGEIIVKTTLYINCSVSPISEYLLHENNGIIYNLGEIDGKEYLKGTGRIVELELAAEVNGELYNDITVDKVNRTVTINNLTPETDYDINLIASLEPYVERSRTIKQRTIKAPPATLMAGEQFRQTLEGMSGFEYVTAIRFEQKSGTLSGIDVSEAKDGRIKSRISGSILYVEANGEIFANSDCSTMFGTFGYPDFGVNGILNEITFNNFNTSKVTTMQAMFYSCKLLTNLDVSNFDTSNVTNMYEMFYDCGSLISIKGLENFNTSKVEDMSYMFDSCYYLNGEITIMNPNITNYTDMFDSCTSKDGRFIINYAQGCKVIAENMIATFSSGPIIPFNGLVLGTEINILNYMVKKIEK